MPPIHSDAVRCSTVCSHRWWISPAGTGTSSGLLLFPQRVGVRVGRVPASHGSSLSEYRVDVSCHCFSGYTRVATVADGSRAVVARVWLSTFLPGFARLRHRPPASLCLDFRSLVSRQELCH